MRSGITKICTTNMKPLSICNHCPKCDIYLDYKDAHQCSDSDCPCHTPHEPLHPEVKHCYDCKQLTCPTCTGCHNEKCIDEVAKTSCGLLAKVNKLHQECTVGYCPTENKGERKFPHPFNAGHVCTEFCKDAHSAPENKGEGKLPPLTITGVGRMYVPEGMSYDGVKGPTIVTIPPTTQSWSERKAYTGWEADFVRKFWVSRIGGDHVGAQHDAVDFIRKIVQEAVEQERKRIVEMVEKLIEKHKDQACRIADTQYDEVNMTKYIENPLVRTLAFSHIDVVRELSDAIDIIKNITIK